MLKFEHTEVVGWEAAIRGMRNPLESWEKSDSYWNYHPCEECNGNASCIDDFHVSSNDLDLMTRLRNAGTDHRKFMRMLVVYVDITGPLYWWKEFDTYKVGTQIAAPPCTASISTSSCWRISAMSIYLLCLCPLLRQRLSI